MERHRIDCCRHNTQDGSAMYFQVRTMRNVLKAVTPKRMADTLKAEPIENQRRRALRLLDASSPDPAKSTGGTTDAQATQRINSPQSAMSTGRRVGTEMPSNPTADSSTA